MQKIRNTNAVNGQAQLFERLRGLVVRLLNSTRFTFGLVGVAVFCGLSTYGALTTASPLDMSNNRLFLLLYLDLFVLLALFLVIGRRIARLLASRKQGVAGSRLQVRLVTSFALMAAIPVLVTTVFSAGLLYFGLHGWFDKQVRTAVTESLQVATSYLNEHQQLIKADILAMGNDLDRQAPTLRTDDEALKGMMRTQSFLRNFSEIALLQPSGTPLIQSGFLLPGLRPVSAEQLQAAKDVDVLILTSTSDDRIEAVMPLPLYGDVYLYAARAVDPLVLGRVDRTRAAVKAYEAMSNTASRMQMTVTLVYLMVAALLMMSAVWFGLSMARRLTRPIAVLITAADRLRAGDTSARVPMLEQMDDFSTLATAFNRMGEELDNQRGTLLATNRNLDERRRFTETVLNNVSTGVLSVDSEGVIGLANPAAKRQLRLGDDELKTLPELAPRMGEALKEFCASPATNLAFDMQHLQLDGQRRNWTVRFVRAAQTMDAPITITFDDITDLAAAQKSAAWQDVARRIAHEIKNPLTPIQLSAERLKKRYLTHLEGDKDREVLERCTDTIVRHVEDIKNMVNAFSNLARMPQAKIETVDIVPLAADTLALHHQAAADIQFNLIAPPTLTAQVDPQLMRQALTNLVQNAIDACREVPQQTAHNIGLHLTRQQNAVYVGVLDTGAGIDPKVRGNVLEPYITTKKTGTGLGLAIVSRIAEDHGGTLLVMPELVFAETEAALNIYTGARFYMRLPQEG